MTTKEQEIDRLSKYAARIRKEGDTYLASLFTEDMVSWVAAQIRLDMNVDLYEYVNAYHRATDKTREAEYAIKELQHALEAKETKAERIAAMRIAQLEKETANLTCSRDSAARIASSHAKKIDEMRALWSTALEAQHAAEESLRTQEIENRNLKAHLYDLMTK